MSGTPSVTVRRADAVAVLQIARPHRRNAIDSRCLDEFDAALGQVEDDASLLALVVTGDEAAFSSGQDLKEPEPPDYLTRFNAVVSRLEQLPKPTVAALSGWCIAGGLEFALACDFRVASQELNIGDFHARINSIGGGGMTARLPRLIGLSQAKRLMFTGDLLGADEALGLGLIDEVHPPTDYLDAAVALASRSVVSDPLTVAFAKRALHEGLDLPLRDAVDRALELHLDLQARLGAPQQR